MNYGHWMLLLNIFAIAVCIATPAHVCGWVRWPEWGRLPSGFRFSVNVEWRVA